MQNYRSGSGGPYVLRQTKLVVRYSRTGITLGDATYWWPWQPYYDYDYEWVLSGNPTRQFFKDFSTYGGALLGTLGGFLPGGVSSNFRTGKAYIAARSGRLHLSTRGIVGNWLLRSKPFILYQMDIDATLANAQALSKLGNAILGVNAIISATAFASYWSEGKYEEAWGVAGGFVGGTMGGMGGALAGTALFPVGGTVVVGAAGGIGGGLGGAWAGKAAYRWWTRK